MPRHKDVADSLTHVTKLLRDNDPANFVERFNMLNADLVDFAQWYYDLKHFYDHEKPM
jgi:hypothetical protein